MSKAKLVFHCPKCNSIENALTKVDYSQSTSGNPCSIILTFKCQNCIPDNIFEEIFYSFAPHDLKDINSYLKGCPDPCNFVSIYLDIKH